MRLVGLGFAGDLFAAQFVLGLGGAEEVRSQFGAAHVIEDLLALLQAFAGMNVLCSEATVEAHVAVVLEDGIVARLDHTSAFGRIRQLRVVHPQFGADGEAALLLHRLIAQLLPPGLNGKVGLALGHDFLGRISVLDDEVAGVARHHHGLERTLGTATDLDHFGDVNEMVLYALAAVETGGAGLLHHGFKIAVVVITEHAGEVAAGPEFVARRIRAADGFKGSDVVIHKSFYPSAFILHP